MDVPDEVRELFMIAEQASQRMETPPDAIWSPFSGKTACVEGDPVELIKTKSQ
jgi:hypothetical protein